MKVFYLMLISLTLISCNYGQSNSKAKEVFENHMSIVSEFINAEVDVLDGDKLAESVSFIEQLTGINSSITEEYDPMKIPSNEDFEKWKKWYEDNKNLLVWDEKDKVIKVDRN